MKKNNCNKLVRDKIPNILIKENKAFKAHSVSGENLINQLGQKAVEESTELKDALLALYGLNDISSKPSDNVNNVISEMADIMEVLITLTNKLHIKPSQISDRMKEKANTNGKFNDGIFLEWAES